MKLTVIRGILSEKSTIGILYVDGVKECFTLEDKVREIAGVPVSQWKIQDVTAIPYGTYKVIIDVSQKFNKEMMHILDVPGFEGVRIHSGNVAEDTEGCILVGTTVGKDRLNNSTAAKDSLFSKVKAALDRKEEVTITIK